MPIDRTHPFFLLYMITEASLGIAAWNQYHQCDNLPNFKKYLVHLQISGIDPIRCDSVRKWCKLPGTEVLQDFVTINSPEREL